MAKFPKIPGYKIVGQLREGNLAEVYLGIQEALDRRVAIKILKPHLLQDKVITARFIREAKAPANLFHSNIVQIIDTGTTGDCHYIVMEYLEESLREQMRLIPDGKMEPKIALDIVEILMKALDYAHFKGVYHRDIKPENIMFREDGTPILVDFGIAGAFDAADQLTRSGQAMGTAYYMSPEQARAKKKIDGRTDIYSLGAVLYEMLTGQKPYDGPSFISVVLMHIEDPVPSLPQELSQYQPLIDKMMAKEREDRISSKPELDELLKTIGIAPRITTPPGKETFPLPTPGQTAPKPIKLIEPRADETAGSLFRKVTAPLKRLAKRFLELLIGKVLPFLGHMIEKVSDFFDKMFEKLNPRMNQPIVKKVVLVYFPAVVIFAVILIIIFNQGYQSSTNQAAPSGITLPFFGDIYKQAPGYYEKLNQLHELYKEGKLKSLNDAQGLIDELKKTAIIPELEELEKKITNRIKLLDKLSKKYFDMALEYYKNDDLPKAMEYVLKAKTINPTDKDILRLEKLIEKQLKDKNRKEIPTTE